MTMMTYRFAPAFDDEDDDDDGDGDYKDDDDGGVPVWSSLLSGCFSETGRQSSPLRAEKHLVILDHHDNDHHDVIFDHQDYDDVIVDIDDHDYVIVDHHDHDDVILDHHDHDDNDGHDHDDSLDDGDSGDDDFDDQDDHKNDDDDAKNVLNLKQRVEHSVLLDRVGMDTLHNNDYSENDSNCDSESDSNRDKLSLIMVTTTNVMILMRWCWDEPGMSRGWVGIDRLDLLVACQQIMMMVLLISRASMMITCTLSSTTCRWGTFPTPPAGTKEVMLIVMVVILMILVNMMVIEMIVVNIMLYSKHGNVFWISWFSKK